MRCLGYTLFCCITISSTLAGLFEFADIEDLAYIWNNRSTLVSRQSKCTAKLPGDKVIEGVCKSKTECLLSKGVPRGSCGILSTCCTYERSCGRTTNSKVSYFTSGSNLLQYGAACPYYIRVMNENICQIRLDFVDFDLALPTLETIIPALKAFRCVDESLRINPGTGIPELCGYNAGQHLYVHVPFNTREVSLHIKLKSRSETKWNIKITQLECGGRQTTIKQHKKDDIIKFEQLAPQGCLQYYTEPSGTFKSFGFDESNINRIYVANQHYSICFKRSPYVCGVRFTAQYFKVAKLLGSNTDRLCPDYLFVPELENQDYIARLCGDLVTPYSFSSNAPGPLHVDFYANAVYDGDTKVDGGFKIDYDLKQCI